MWQAKRAASPASSTSTVDQQEIIFDDIHQVNQNVSNANNTNSNINNCNNNNINSNQIINNNIATKFNNTSNNINNFNITTNSIANNIAATQQNNNATGNTTTNAKCSPPKRTKLCEKPKSYKRPKLNHLPQQMAPWKSLQHHFLRNTDVKYRPEKRLTMAELSNEVLQRRNGWKVHHLVGQLADLIESEMQTRDRLNSLLDIFIEDGASRVIELSNNCHKLPEQYATLLQSQRSYGKNEFKPELIVTKLDDLLRGDLQRNNMFDDQLRDCRDLIVRVTNEHRDRVARITTKFNKRIQL